MTRLDGNRRVKARHGSLVAPKVPQRDAAIVVGIRVSRRAGYRLIVALNSSVELHQRLQRISAVVIGWDAVGIE